MISNYEEAVNVFIPQAIQEADRQVMRRYFLNPEDYTRAWNLAYHSEMVRLTKEAGVRNLG